MHTHCFRLLCTDNIMRFVYTIFIMLCLIPAEVTCKGGGRGRSRDRSRGGGGGGSLSPFLAVLLTLLGSGVCLVLFLACCYTCPPQDCLTPQSPTDGATSQPEQMPASQSDTSTPRNETTENQTFGHTSLYQPQVDGSNCDVQRHNTDQRGDYGHHAMLMEAQGANNVRGTEVEGAYSGSGSLEDQGSSKSHYAPPPSYEEVQRNPIYNKAKYSGH